MAGWIVGIYLLLGIALVIGCEFGLNTFDESIESVNELYDMKLGDISKMFVKGFIQFTYLVLWWLVIIVAIIYVVNNWE